MSGPFVAHVSRWRTGLLVLGSLGFVATGAWLATLPGDPFRSFVGGVGMLLFGSFALVGARQLFRSGPVLRVDADGIWWQRWSDRTIPWPRFVMSR